MQIFVTDKDPNLAVKWLDDRRLNKMIVETVQILSHSFNGPYKLTHKHHPCVKWSLESQENRNWLVQYLVALYNERVLRTGKGHLSYAKFVDFTGIEGATYNIDKIKFCNCTPYKGLEVIEAYRHLIKVKQTAEV